MKWLLAVLLAAVFAFTALAADITGTWKGSADTPMGTVDRTFVFKQDGTKLTGETSSSMFGKSTIDDGKVDGDNISFTVTISYQGNDVKINYTGKIDGEQLKLHVESPAGPVDYVVKKVS
jgi:opacity protein-like surface antigen